MELITLENGTRIVLEPKEDAMSAAVYIYVGCGSSSEGDGEEGLAHFTEHMVFKGSEHYSAREIAELTDMYGGNINAYTTKEYTCYFARALTENIPSLVNIMADMLCRPLFEQKAVDTERGVITEEIGMYEDSPDELCFDLLDTLVWKGSRLAHPILGTRSTVAGIDSRALHDFVGTRYAPEKTVISVCGKFEREPLLEEITESFGKKAGCLNGSTVKTPEFQTGELLRRKDTEQTHIILALPGLCADDPDRYKASVFTEILGGSTSSRLNMRIREELGLVYTTYSFSAAYSRVGAFGLYAALNSENQLRFSNEALTIMDKMRDFSDSKELYKVKQQFKSGMIMSTESTAGTASSLGKQLLLRGKCETVADTASKIEAVTEEDIRYMAGRLFKPSSLALTVLGEPRKSTEYKKAFEKFI